MEIIRRHSGSGKPSEQRTNTFTGAVYADALLGGTDGVTVTSVFFGPAARTFWHSHERGQLLHVLEGRGLAGTLDGKPQPLSAGDLVWAPPGELHWHGGGPDSMLLHLAVSLGVTTWHSAVSDAEYGGGQ
jgi:quercetin dioxygenase-like cupin family protein